MSMSVARRDTLVFPTAISVGVVDSSAWAYPSTGYCGGDTRHAHEICVRNGGVGMHGGLTVRLAWMHCTEVVASTCRCSAGEIQ